MLIGRPSTNLAVPGTVILLCLLVTFPARTATLYLTRHYEKTAGPNPGLTEQGARRAENLATYMTRQSIGKIFSTPYKRTTDTARPTSVITKTPITHYDPSKLQDLADSVSDSHHNVLIVGHSNTTPQLIKLLGGPVVVIKEDDYGVLYKIEVGKDKDRFSQTTIPVPN
ncbi:SixA phosphatase family protein [Alteromonas halophila]|uniref:Histidine phosphatase family protein n=1 Tax=Alteromonas halophila TaxID=516698 RepID=A0A918JQ29_9ALTE|nr:histidine phosphatase family protein [Alteromonas halophila]GGW92613.1 hypothetical protein GCM10007391_28750 [Alteromonas halophila]